MAIVTGVTGQVTIPHAALGMATGTPNEEPTDVIHLFKWTANITRDTLDVSNWGSAAVPDNTNARQKIGSMYHMTGSAEGFLPSNVAFDLDPTYPVGAPVQQEGIQKPDAAPVAGFVLKSHEAGVTDREITFVGIISNLSVASEKQGLNTYSFNFESHGDITGIT